MAILAAELFEKRLRKSFLELVNQLWILHFEGSKTAAQLEKHNQQKCSFFNSFFLHFFALRNRFSIPVFAPRAPQIDST